MIVDGLASVRGVQIWVYMYIQGKVQGGAEGTPLSLLTKFFEKL